MTPDRCSDPWLLRGCDHWSRRRKTRQTGRVIVCGAAAVADAFAAALRRGVPVVAAGVIARMGFGHLVAGRGVGGVAGHVAVDAGGGPAGGGEIKELILHKPLENLSLKNSWLLELQPRETSSVPCSFLVAVAPALHPGYGLSKNRHLAHGLLVPFLGEQLIEQCGGVGFNLLGHVVQQGFVQGGLCLFNQCLQIVAGH